MITVKLSIAICISLALTLWFERINKLKTMIDRIKSAIGDLSFEDLFGADMPDDFEDYLQACGVFRNGLNDKESHQDSYMTVIDYVRLERALGEVVSKFDPSKSDWLNLTECWDSNSNTPVTLKLISKAICGLDQSDKLPPTPCSAPSVAEILYTHPSESFYHDNTIWFPHPFCETGSGLWLKPGQAIAIINLPNDKDLARRALDSE